MNPFLLTQIIRDLTEHQDALWLKKLLIYLCQQVWENDQIKIDNADWQKLIEELINKKSSFVSLKKYIHGMAKTTNKPKKYLLVADLLISKLEKIYFVEEDVTQACTAKYQREIAPQKKIDREEIVKVYDPFKVRAEIVSNINPLRAKILLFSAIYDRFTYSNQDWASLKSHQLDELIQELINICPTFTKLAGKLELAANILQEADENLKIAKVISQSLKPFYPTTCV